MLEKQRQHLTEDYINIEKTPRNLTPFQPANYFRSKDIISTNMPNSSSLTNW